MIFPELLHRARDLPNVEWLHLFLEEIEEAGLSRNSLRRLERRLTMAVENRMQLSACERNQVRDPVLIVGIPRTGTTFLHDLLSLVWRAPTVAESRQPFAYPSERLAEARRHLKLTYAVIPELRAVHPMRADGPEELRVMLEPSFKTNAWTLHYPAHRYSSLVDAANLSDGWELVGRTLTHLSDGRRWVLKDTAHAGHVETFLQVFPRAQVIWCHRDPAPATASLLSLLDLTFGGVGSQVAHFMLAKNVADLRLLQHTLSDMSSVHHVDFEELNDNPRQVVERIVGNVPREVDRWIKAHPKDEHGAHRYSAVDYGLDENSVRYAFGGLR